MALTKATLREKNATLREKNATLREKNATLREKNATLREENATLREEARLANTAEGLASPAASSRTLASPATGPGTNGENTWCTATGAKSCSADLVKLRNTRMANLCTTWMTTSSFRAKASRRNAATALRALPT
jgi:hypothetical protein